MRHSRRPRNEVARLKRSIRRLAHDRRVLREDLGALLDLVPMVNLAEGIPDAAVKLVLRGQFLPHIAQLLTTTLLAFKGTNLVEWDVTDPHGRGAFLLTIQRNDGMSAMQLKRQVQGGALMGISHVLHEEVLFDRGAITSRDWRTYPILTMAEAPHVEVVLINNPDARVYLGASEAANTLPPPAIAAAVFDAIGRPPRTLPLKPAYIQQLLRA